MKKMFVSGKSVLRRVFVVVCILMGITSINALAKNALYSDIGVYINNYPISGYAVDGKIVVVAEDLREYGFDVEWNETDRALYISRDKVVNSLKKRDVYKSEYATGTKFSDVYPTDIKVYYDGIKMESFAINGYTLIPLNDLATLAGSEEWVGETRTYKVWIDDLSVCDYEPIRERTTNLWYTTNSKRMPSFEYNTDMDSDGKNETVKFTVNGYDRNGYLSLSLSVGNEILREITIEGWTFDVDAVYLTDLIPNDGAKELAVFFCCDSGDPEMRIFRYSDGYLRPLQFVTPYAADSLYTGNSGNFMFDVHDDGSFTMIKRSTGTIGMWLVYVTYKSDTYDNIYQVPQYQYIIAEGWGYEMNEMGYVRVNKTFTGGGLPLYKGEWIKAIADDMNGNVLIQKSNGQTGWFYVGSEYEYNYRDELNEVSSLFWMAG